MPPTIKNLLRILLVFGLFSIFANLQINAFPHFDRDGKADFAVFRPSDRNWYVYSSENKTVSVTHWGLANDHLVPGDYDGDGLTDIAVWRQQTGIWYVLRSSDNSLFAVKWGMQPPTPPPGTISFLSADDPQPADYDGDNITDFAVWRPDTGVWYILKSTANFNQNEPQIFKWGRLGDSPVPADYDGDGKADYAYFNGSWRIFQSRTASERIINFGSQGDDLLVPADYDGDGKTDAAVYRNGVWFIQRSDNGQTEIHYFGLRGDTPVPADYDGDKKADVAVYRKGVWYVLRSSTSQTEVFNFGLNGDVPLSSLNVKYSIVGIP